MSLPQTEEKKAAPKDLARRWCWTLNNYSPDDEKKILACLDETKCHYIIFGRETAPTTGTKHLQGYSEFAKPIRLAGVKKLFGFATMHVEPCRGDAKSNIEYCSKGGDYVQVGRASKDQGRFARLVERCQEPAATMVKLTQEFPEEVVRNRSAVRATLDMFQNENMRTEIKEKADRLKPYPWQQKLLEELKEKPDDRKVVWYHDPAGGAGKNMAIRMAIAEFGAENVFFCSGGAFKDIICAYQKERIVMFNFTRSVEDVVPYGAMEALKDGMAFSAKYESKSKIFNSPHVYVMANFHPDMSKLTKDRWDIRTLSGQAPQTTPAPEIPRAGGNTEPPPQFTTVDLNLLL